MSMNELDRDTISILMVCTGNIGRSPMMERIMRRTLEGKGVSAQFKVTSAGTWARQGQEMETGAVLALTQLGIDSSGFTASPLTGSAVAAADLVLVATRDHRSEVVNLVPAAVRRTFTLHELARIAASAPPRDSSNGSSNGAGGAKVRDAVAWAAQVRGAVPRPEAEGDDDVGDPLGAPDEVYRERAAAIAASVERIVPYLLGRGQAG